MTRKVNPHFIDEVKRYGAFDISACFNCGNCTAICPLSTEGNEFPRRIIRYAQVGMEKEVAFSPEVWLCYYCGECSATCPRQAEPGEFMAAARRVAVAKADVSGLAALLLKNPWTAIAVLVVFSMAFAGLLLYRAGQFGPGQENLFGFIPGKWIHDLGVALLIIVGIDIVVSLIRLFSNAKQYLESRGHKSASCQASGS